MLPVVWSWARERGHGVADLAAWLAAAPARLVGLDARKGAITPGRDADMVIFDPDATFEVDPAALYHRHPITPYAGRVLHGVVRATFLSGHPVWEAAAGRFAGRPMGSLLAREASR
jgi:allantoinase